MKQVAFDESNELGKLMSNAMPKSLMPRHEAVFQKFSYREPTLRPGKKRGIVRLVTGDVIMAAVQKFTDGGEVVMHSHDALDGFWMVLRGAASFVGADGIEHLVGPMEGMLVPRETPYAFKSVGSEPLQILQVEALYPGRENTAKRYKDGSIPAPDAGVDPGQVGKVMDLFDARE